MAPRSPRRETPATLRGADDESSTSGGAKAARAESARGDDRLSVGIVVPIAFFVGLAYYYYSEYNVLWLSGQPWDTPAATPLTTPVFMTLAYLFGIKAGNTAMARREPLKVRNWMLVYNVYQAILNVVMVYGLVKTALFDVADSDSPYWPIWGRRVDGGRSGWSLSFWLWVHYHNKFIEFFDTAFMVARKSTRQISFLHVYHHVLLVWAWLIVMRNAPGGDAYFGATMNSAVHVVMYTYYAMRLLKLPVPWKAMVTKIQLVQFVICAADSLYILYLGDDYYPRWMTLVQLFVMLNMLVLFSAFYAKAYNKRKTQWALIDGTKYDITDFVERHPGGSDMLMLAVGRDASVMFHSYHRRLHVARAMLAALPVIEEGSSSSDEDSDQGGRRGRGNARGSRRSSTPTGRAANGRAEAGLSEDLNTSIGDRVLGASDTIESPLYAKLRERVNEYFERTGKSSRGGALMYIKSAILLLTLGSAYTAAVIVVPEYGFYIAPFIGVMMAMVGLSIQHDANHGALSPNPMVNRVCGLLDDLIGGSALMWRHQHNIAHHAHPNDHELDADTVSNFPLIRMNPILPVRWYLRFQHLYAPLLYSLLGIAYPIGDIAGYLRKTYEHVKLQPLRSVDTWCFILGKVVHYSITLALPIYLNGWAWGIGFFLVMQCVGGNFLASVFAVSHNAEANDYNCAPGTDWAEQQIRTSCNWSPHSTFWWIISGGLNFQIEHHLFPGICHVHYPALHKIVREVCEEEGLPYNSYGSFYDIYTSHLRALRLLGRGEDHQVFHKEALKKLRAQRGVAK